MRAKYIYEQNVRDILKPKSLGKLVKSLEYGMKLKDPYSEDLVEIIDFGNWSKMEKYDYNQYWENDEDNLKLDKEKYIWALCYNKNINAPEERYKYYLTPLGTFQADKWEIINEQNIRDILRPKSEEEILAALPGRTDINFKPTDKFPDGTSFHDTTISTSYKNLVKLFGKPNSPGDEYKVSSEWVLEDDRGYLVTIYDWKETDLYDSSNPSVEEFRELDSYSWHIGGTRIEDEENLQAFVISRLIKMNK